MMKWTWLWLLWAAVGLSVLTTAAWPQNHARAVRAKRVINDQDIWQYNATSIDHPAFWQSNHQLLYDRGSQHLAYLDGPMSDEAQVGWTLVDVANGQSVLLNALKNDHLLGGLDGESDAQALLSPDGKWLLSYEVFGPDSGKQYGDISMLDGSHHRSLLPDEYSKIYWLDDSQHWVGWDPATESHSYQRIVVHSVSVPLSVNDAVQELRLPEESRVNVYNVIRLVSRKRCLTLIGDMTVDRHGFLHIAEWDLNRPGSPTRKYKISLGKGAEVVDAEKDVRISAGGKRVACLVAPHHGRPCRIVVSALDGTKRHDVVGLPHMTNGWIDSLEWSPDGKRLSFHYDGSIWVIPAD